MSDTSPMRTPERGLIYHSPLAQLSSQREILVVVGILLRASAQNPDLLDSFSNLTFELPQLKDNKQWSMGGRGAERGGR